MGNYDKGLAQLFPEVEEKGVYLLLCAGVKVAGGFIGKHYGRRHLEGAGNGYA